MAEQFLDFPQILSHLVEEDRGRGVAQPMRGDLPYPRALQAARSRKLNARLENGAPEYPANTNCDPAKFISPGARIRRPLKPSWIAFHSLSAWLSAGNRHILEDVPLALDPQRHDFLPHPLAIAPCELDQFLEPASGLEKGVRQVESEGRAISLLADFEIVKESADFGKKKVADLGFVLERWLDFGAVRILAKHTHIVELLAMNAKSDV